MVVQKSGRNANVATLRNLIDAKAVDTMDKSDAFGHLKNVKQAKMNYDLAKQQLHQKLAPARQMIDMVDKEHPLDSNNPNNGQEVDPETGQPIQENQNTMMKPGMRPNPNSMRQNTSQNLKQDKPVAKKPNPAEAKANPNKKTIKPKNDGKGRFEVHVKAEEDSAMIDQMNVRKKKKKLHGNDYHDTPQLSQMPSRGIGLSTSKKKHR